MTSNAFDLSISKAFNNQVTLGLLTVLRNTTGVRNLILDPRLPCDEAKISQWEQRNTCLLPDDVRAFYRSCDGFKLTWSYRMEGVAYNTSTVDNAPSSWLVGNIAVNALSDLALMCDIKLDTVSVGVYRNLQLLDKISSNDTPNFTEHSKIFELDSSADVGHVCLVYLDNQVANRPDIPAGEEPSDASVWLLDTSYRWHFLAPNFSNYFRKSLVHMGLTHWQLKFTDLGLSSVGEFFMNLVAPYLNVTMSALGQPNGDEQAPANTSEPNHFDPGVLKTKFKNPKSNKIL